MGIKRELDQFANKDILRIICEGLAVWIHCVQCHSVTLNLQILTQKFGNIVETQMHNERFKLMSAVNRQRVLRRLGSLGLGLDTLLLTEVVPIQSAHSIDICLILKQWGVYSIAARTQVQVPVVSMQSQWPSGTHLYTSGDFISDFILDVLYANIIPLLLSSGLGAKWKSSRTCLGQQDRANAMLLCIKVLLKQIAQKFSGPQRLICHN